MKGVTPKPMAAVVSPADGGLTVSRTAPRVLPGPDNQAGSGSTPVATTPADDPNALAPSLHSFIVRHSLPYQLFLILVTLISFPFLYFSLELPKAIINRAIGGKQFPQTVLGVDLD